MSLSCPTGASFPAGLASDSSHQPLTDLLAPREQPGPKRGLTAPDATCTAGYYCPNGTSAATLRCPVGFACPAGSAAPGPCLAGTYQDTAGAAACKACTAGSYCALADPCSPGNYIVRRSRGCGQRGGDGLSAGGEGWGGEESWFGQKWAVRILKCVLAILRESPKMFQAIVRISIFPNMFCCQFCQNHFIFTQSAPQAHVTVLHGAETSFAFAPLQGCICFAPGKINSKR